MRGLKKGFSACLAAALFLTALPVNGVGQVQAAQRDASSRAADVVVAVQPQNASKFNDTNGDGFGEFEGWGTSLCWWANRLGYSEQLTQQAADVFFSDNGLDMNIGRYNVGGGDNVYQEGEVETPGIKPNEKAAFYGVEGDNAPAYGGSKMGVETNDKLKDTGYTVSDADFGFAKGDKVGSLKQIGWVNELGAADGDGGNLNYTVNVADAGKYTVKMLWTLNGTNKRAVALRVNNDSASDKVVSGATMNQSEIASAGGEHLFLAVFQDVELKAGDNTIAIGGNAAQSTDGNEAWAPNFVRMLVVKSGDEGKLPEETGSKFAHPSHIKRSDSVVPGYCVDVTEITDEHPLSWYQENFDRADAECGFAWNYDWNADKNQVNILKAAIAANDEFLAEAFSNSPPYFMTNSGCSSGAADSSKDNLRADSYHAFALYMADVIEYWAQQGIYFQSATGMNEPDTEYWGANSNKQEGCHFDPGDSQSKIIVALNEELQKKAAAATNADVKKALTDIIISGTDETSIDTAINSYNALSNEAKEIVTRIDTHTYGGSKRAELCSLAEEENKNLWMSEVDGAYTAGTNAGEMTGALGLAERIMTDLKGLKSSAWILWNAVDMHVDADASRDGGFDADTLQELLASTSEGGKGVNLNAGYWGIAIGDHNSQNIILTKKYEAFGQFSRYIRPGYTLIGSTGNTLAAWDTQGKKLVVVAANTKGEDQRWTLDLNKFTAIDSAKFSNVSAYRTSGSMENGEKWADVSSQIHAESDAAQKTVSVDMKANSITTFIIEGVDGYDAEGDYESAEAQVKDQMWDDVYAENDKIIAQNQDKIEKLALTADMVTGSAPWNNGTVDVPQNVVDGDLDSFFDGVTNGWVQIDLGKEVQLAGAAYAPRGGQYTGRCVGASFYGSKDGENWTLLYTITETPPEKKLTKVDASRFKAPNETFRYIKYAVPKDDTSANCNIAEIELYQMKEKVAFKEPEYPENFQEWVAYYKNQTEQNKYSDSSKKVLDDALKEADALLNSSDTAAQGRVRRKLALAYLALEPIYTYDSISGVKGAEIRDTNGKVIQAHGGQIQQLTVNGKTKWYWIGEDKTNDYRPCPGIHMYTSEDLYNWTDEGVVLKTAKTFEEFKTDPYFTSLYGDLETEEEQKRIFTDIWQGSNANEGCVIERPKMLYNEKTGKYVIWFHADGQDPFASSSGGNYAKAKAGVAIADSPTGPYKLLGSYLLNYNEDADHGFDGDVGGHVRDMNLFKDDDGSAYVMYSSDGNQTMHIARLNDEYTNLAKPQGEAKEGVDFTRNFIGESREAPAMFKYNNKYYIITSGCTGWSPNRASYAVADHPLGPWTTVGDPCTDEGSGTTYDTQSTCVFPVDAAKGQFIYMGDRWSNPDTGNALRDSRYVWLPVEFLSGNKIALRRYSDWKLEDVFQIKDTAKLQENVSKAEKLKEADYTPETWKVFDAAYQAAVKTLESLQANQAAVDKANTDLEEAMKQLKTMVSYVKEYLAQEIRKNQVPEADKDLYTKESWDVYQIMLKEAQGLLDKESVTMEQAEDALKAMKDAKFVLEKKAKKDQAISYTKKYTKALGDKVFKLNAKVTKGDGALSFTSSDKKVAVVDKKGKVTVKGIGTCTITVKAASTKAYNAKSVKVSLTVNPKKAVLSSVKPVSGKKLKVTWKKDSKATGYIVQYSLNKNFKKIEGKATIKKSGTTSTTLTKKLKKGKKYYVRVQEYKTVKVNGKNKNFYGDWSKAILSGKIK